MATTITNIVTMYANDEAIDKINERFDNAGGYSDMVLFAQAFYENPELVNDGVSIKWSNDNMGSKWVYIENSIDMDRWNISSANYYPHEFLERLFNLLIEIDPDAYIVNKYNDESNYLVGVVVLKKDSDGNPMWYNSDEYMEDPTNDMDWDDEGYDDTRQEFIYQLEEYQYKKETYGIQMIGGGNGNPFKI